MLSEAFFSDAYQRGFLCTLKFLRSCGANGDLAEEVAQAAWARGWQCRHQLLNPDVVVAWVNSIARNLYRTAVVGGQRFGELEERSAPNRMSEELEARVVMEGCSEMESNMLQMFYLEGYSTVEIAEKIAMKPTTVRVRLMRIRRTIRARMQPSADVRPELRAA